MCYNVVRHTCGGFAASRATNCDCMGRRPNLTASYKCRSACVGYHNGEIPDEDAFARTLMQRSSSQDSNSSLSSSSSSSTHRL
ncbi:hypothetical protein AURDEDRAFT_156070 [Auricularia subglabra TFB-10046 SS5]|nr:hypothetical protein AURDEDRAFT_156070 [Auricularia subglabra TFB-10046 SS5]